MIRLEGLRVRAGDFALAVDELSVAPGQYVMILGPTASGKTVLLETLAGLRRPQGGRIWFGERDVTAEPPERRGAGLVYQDYALFPHLTVAQNIGFGPRARRDRVRELAGMLGIDGLLDRYPEGLSGGEQQRVALARALAIEPEVLLLDEPLSALDGPTRLELQRELGRVHRELGATVMHVTHDLDEALALGDRVAVLIGGEIRQVDTPQQVTRYPVDLGVARLVGVANVFAAATGAGVDGDLPGGDKGGRRRRVRLENDRELIAEGGQSAPLSSRLFAAIRAEEIEVQLLRDGIVEAHGGWDEPGTGEWVNEMEGTVRSVQVQSVHASVEVEVPPDAALGVLASQAVFTAHVLRPQVEKLGLTAGSRVLLRIPARAVHLCSDAVPQSGT